MAKTNISRRIISSISEWSVFKFVIIAYLIFFALGVVIFAVFFLLSWMGLEIPGTGFENTGITATMQSFGINMTNINLFSGAAGVMGIIIFILVGLLFSVVFAAIVTFFAWIFNIILKISGGIELRFKDRNTVADNKASKPLQSD
jgi:hypothetical protein